MTYARELLETFPARGREDIDALGPWFHNLHLPDGRQTNPHHPFGDFPRCKWTQIEPHLPPLEGLRVLDIGCNAGFYSFEMARRGGRVLAIDHDLRYLRQARWAAARMGASGIRFRRRQVYDLAREDERFDLVLFMGVFYHLRYPLLALDIVAALEPEWLVFQTLTADVGEIGGEPAAPIGFDQRAQLTRRDWPFMAFIEGYLADDPTNWWAPNHAAVCALLRAAGFQVVARPGHEIYLCRRSPQTAVWPLDPDELAAATGTGASRRPQT